MPFVPHARQQRFLLHAHTREVLFGGAAGGGKTVACLMAAAQFFHVPGYAALIVRSSFPDLMQPKALIPLSKQFWYGRPGAEWNSVEHRWRFQCPGGGESSLTFGYVERDDDVYQYQGAEYHLIIFDELTQHSEMRYRYLFSRQRRESSGPLSRVPLRMRATANPGGRGHEWVYTRLVNDATRVEGATFVPSRLEDNPSIDYDTYVQSLSHLDPLTRRRLLDGDWTAVEEGRFKRDWLKRYTRHGTTYRIGPNRFVEIEKLKTRFLTVDAAATVKQTAGHDPDYTVISAWAYGENQLFWTGCVALRMEVPEIPAAVAREYQLHRAQKVYFRPSGMEKAVPQLCRRHTSPAMNVVELPTKGDKLQSAAEVLNLAEAGRLWFPSPGCAYPHTSPGFQCEEVESQILRFTGDKDVHDDIWDTMGIAGTVVESGAASLAGSAAPFVVMPT